jgi:hypothetical protein
VLLIFGDRVAWWCCWVVRERPVVWTWQRLMEKTQVEWQRSQPEAGGPQDG